MQLFPEIIQHVSEASSEALSFGDQVEDTVKLTTETHSTLDGLIAKALKTGGVKIDCKIGCAWCCHYRVEASAPEVIAIANYIRQQFTTEQESALNDRILQAISFRKQAGTTSKCPCPMLVDGVCSIYPVRPIACRGWNSRSAAKCKAAHDKPVGQNASIPIYGVINALAESVSHGLRDALNQHRLDSDSLDFNSAIHQALNNDDAAVLWRFGEHSFESSSPLADSPDIQK